MRPCHSLLRRDSVHVKWSVILMDRLGPNILLALWMKGQVLDHARAHLKVPGWLLVQSRPQSPRYPCPAERETFRRTRVTWALGTRLLLVWNELLTKKLPVFVAFEWNEWRLPIRSSNLSRLFSSLRGFCQKTDIVVFHMTRTVPRVIFVEKRKKKGPVWGPYAYGGKTRATLLETRSTKSMRVNARMQNFVFFNSSNESENSDNEFSTLANRTVFYRFTTVANHRN